MSWFSANRGRAAGPAPGAQDPAGPTVEPPSPPAMTVPGSEVLAQLSRLKDLIVDLQTRMAAVERELGSSRGQVPRQPAATDAPVAVGTGVVPDPAAPSTPIATLEPPRGLGEPHPPVLVVAVPERHADPPASTPDAPPALRTSVPDATVPGAPAAGTRAERAVEAARRVLGLLDDLERILRTGAGGVEPAGLDRVADARRGWSHLLAEASSPARRAERKGDDGTWFEKEARGLAQHVPLLVLFLDANVDRTRSNASLQAWIPEFCAVNEIEVYSGAAGDRFDPELFESVGASGPPRGGDLRIDQARERGFRHVTTGQVLRKCRVVLRG